jgi:hypothetical protein
MTGLSLKVKRGRMKIGSNPRKNPNSSLGQDLKDICDRTSGKSRSDVRWAVMDKPRNIPIMTGLCLFTGLTSNHRVMAIKHRLSA